MKRHKNYHVYRKQALLEKICFWYFIFSSLFVTINQISKLWFRQDLLYLVPFFPAFHQEILLLPFATKLCILLLSFLFLCFILTFASEHWENMTTRKPNL